ncbi:type VII secretion system-associated protein [Streptomyces sp. NPDC005648]|uniref:type VII secretion system-associated protein n=1 Tax=Streptomyces sp. NPDC005648 TaxID=3157044 RepID=UPI0033B62E99
MNASQPPREHGRTRDTDRTTPRSRYPEFDLAASAAYRRPFGESVDAPDYIHKAAEVAPDHWIAMADPAWQGEGPPPPWTLVGRWRSGPDGTIQEWQENREYRPSPAALGWPDPTDPVDAAIQLASTGYGTAEDVHHSLAAAEVTFWVTADGTPVTGAAPDGTPVLPVHSSTAQLPREGQLLSEVRPVADLLRQLPVGHHLYVNPSGAVSLLVETEPLREAVAAHLAAADTGSDAVSDLPDTEASAAGAGREA